MHPPESLPHPKNGRRRTILKLLGALPLVGALTRDSEQLYNEKMDPIKPHISIERREVTRPVDVLAAGWWQMDGAQMRDGALHLSPLEPRIRNKRRNNQFEVSPPVNLHGTHIRASGAFTATAHMELTPQATVSVRLYSGQPPLRFDDFTFRQNPELECLVSTGAVTVGIRERDDAAARELKMLVLPPANKCQLQIKRRSNGIVQVSIDNHTMAELPQGLLDGEHIWFGLNATGGAARIPRLAVEPLNSNMELVNTNTLQITQPTPNGLQTLVGKDRLLIGTGASLSHMMADERYAQLVLGSEFGSITPENSMKPQDIQPHEGVFTFAQADALVDTALRHGLQVHGHALMFDKAMPAWMHELPYATHADQQRLREVIWAHVHTTVSHFKGRVASWDVWNELIEGFNDNAQLSANPFTLGIGEKAIDIAFQAARHADPQAKLFINDYGLETNPKGRGNFMFGLLRRALQRGAPIDGLGIQGHVYKLPRDRIKPAPLRSILQLANTLRLEARVTELDVTGAHGSGAQAAQFADVAEICLNAPNCTGLAVWGPGDKFGSTVSVQDGRLKPGNALLYDEHFRAKPARYAMAKALQTL